MKTTVGIAGRTPGRKDPKLAQCVVTVDFDTTENAEFMVVVVDEGDDEKTKAVALDRARLRAGQFASGQ